MPWAWNILICSAMMMMTMITVHPFQTSSDWLWHYTYQLITVSHLPFNILFIPQVVIEHVMAHAWALSLSLSLSPSHTLSTYLPWKVGILCHTLSHWDVHIITHIYHISLSLCLSVVLKIQHTHMYTHRIAQHSNAFKDSLVQINTLSKALTHKLSLSVFLSHTQSFPLLSSYLSSCFLVHFACIFHPERVKVLSQSSTIRIEL